MNFLRFAVAASDAVAKAVATALAPLTRELRRIARMNVFMCAIRVSVLLKAWPGASGISSTVKPNLLATLLSSSSIS
jgi:hypothetical protein